MPLVALVDQIPWLSHYVPFFAEHRGRVLMAVCGAHVSLRQHSVQPACPKCAAWLQADDAEAKTLAAQWDAEETAKRAAAVAAVTKREARNDHL